MSAFLCNQKHMQCIADGLFTIRGGESDCEKSTIEQVNRFIAMNLEALAQRYEGIDWGKSPEIKGLQVDLELNVVQLVKALQCLRYQCSEGDVPESEVYRELGDVIHEAMSYTIRLLPDYERADWGIR